MMTTAAAGLFLRGRLDTFHLPTILSIFFAGGFFGWFLAELTGLFAKRSIRHRRLLTSLTILGLAAATVFATAFLFALEYRSFYAQWHAELFTRIWILQFLFTSASAFYQFAVMAVRLYLPLGPVLLIPGAWMMLRRMR